MALDTLLEVTKVNRYYSGGASVRRERTFKKKFTLAEVIEIAKKQGTDIDELIEELEEIGFSSFKGYMVDTVFM